MPSVDHGLCQNMPAVKRSIQFWQQSSALGTGAFAHEAAKACCLVSNAKVLCWTYGPYCMTEK